MPDSEYTASGQRSSTALEAHVGIELLLNRRFNFLGRWIRHAGYFPSWNLRLFRHGLGLYETLSYSSQNSGDNEVHEHVILNGSSGYLGSPWITMHTLPLPSL